jgi:hypothetical protein
MLIGDTRAVGGWRHELQTKVNPNVGLHYFYPNQRGVISPPREFLSLSDKKRQRDGGSKSTDLYEAQKLQLQLEYSLKQYLDYGYHSPELNEVFNLYQDSYPIQRENVKIDGIIYS